MIIIHRCQNCTHPGYSHTAGMCCHGFCRCTQNKPGPSVTLATFDSRTSEEVLEVTQPGTYWNADSYGPAGSRVMMCGCDDCQAIYQALVGSPW